MSDITKKYRCLYITFYLLSILILLAPLVYYFVLAVIEAEVVQKVSLGIMFTMAVILTGINIVFKKHYRSAIWIMLLAIFICVKEILPLIVMLAIATILDEFILTPLYKKFKNLCTINKEIDKRMGD